MTDWIKTSDRLPEPGQKVDWITPRGSEVHGGRFFYQDWRSPMEWFMLGSVLAVYYTPEWWRPAEENE